MKAPKIQKPKGCFTHKEVFTRYLREAPRWKNEYVGGQVIYDWNEWLADEELARCSVTGFYGMLGHEVHFQYDFDYPVLNDYRVQLYDLADHLGYEVEWHQMPSVGEVVTLHHKGQKLYDFCDTFISKEERVIAYLEAKMN